MKLNSKQTKEIQKFLIKRFRELDDQRQEFDDDIKEEIDIFNDKDKHINNKNDWEEQVTVPYIYTIVQTMVARLYQTFFGEDNYIKVFVEREQFADVEKKLQQWIQEKLDIIRFKARSRDFLEDALVQRTVWLQLKPIIEEEKLKKVDFQVFKWFDIWFDTSVAKVEDTDLFARKVVKLSKLKKNKDHYFNLDKIKDTNPPDEIKKKEEYAAKHGVSKYYDIFIDVRANVELLEWYGEYNFGSDESPDYKNIVFTLANREILIRAEEINVELKRKKLFFPIRPLRQANSLIGKSVPQLVKNQQYELNEVRSLRMQNLKTQVKLLFKVKKDSGVDMDDLFAKGGNAIGYEDLPTDIDRFDVPNMVQILSLMGAEIIQDMQQVTGAVDYLMGTTAARGVTETASGIRTITEQALFKFGMMANNIHDDLLDFINSIFVLYAVYDKESVLFKDPELNKYFNQKLGDIEETAAIDLALTDLALRRDVERAQFINAINVIAGLLAQTGGNMKELLKQVMQRFNMQNIDKILEGQAQPPGLENLGGDQTRGGSLKANPQADKSSTPEEEVFNENTPR